jgi:hypothetical protein
MDFELYKKVPHLISAWERNDSKVDGYIYGQVRRFKKLKLMYSVVVYLIIGMIFVSAIVGCVYYYQDKLLISFIYCIVFFALVVIGQTLDMNSIRSFMKTLENQQRFHNSLYVLYDPKEGLSSLSIENVQKRLRLLAGDVVQCEVDDAAAAKVRRDVDTASVYSHTQLAQSKFNMVFNAARSFGNYYGITTKEDMLASVREKMK